MIGAVALPSAQGAELSRRMDYRYKTVGRRLQTAFASLWPHLLCGACVGLQLLFLPICAGCGAAIAELSGAVELWDNCRRAYLVERDHLCTQCGARAGQRLFCLKSCGSCCQRRLQFDRVISLGSYEGLLRCAVLRMKKPTGELLCRVVARLFSLVPAEQFYRERPDVVVPAPMHWSRRLLRGNNGAQIIAEEVAQILRLPLVHRILVRRRNTGQQFRLPPGQRVNNVRDDFCCRTSYPLDGSRALLVDDILTTGATASEAAGVLRMDGARTVSVAGIARTEGGLYVLTRIATRLKDRSACHPGGEQKEL